MIRVVVIDDDASIRRSMARLLRSHGYECVTYDSAESALADSSLLDADCLLIDIELGGMSGFSLRDHLRRVRPLVPYIFITAHSDSSFPSLKAAAGNSLCLTKPVNEELLITSICRITNTSSAG
jgi:FixJ family two-component response regulator